MVMERRSGAKQDAKCDASGGQAEILPAGSSLESRRSSDHAMQSRSWPRTSRRARRRSRTTCALAPPADYSNRSHRELLREVDKLFGQEPLAWRAHTIMYTYTSTYLQLVQEQVNQQQHEVEAMHRAVD